MREKDIEPKATGNVDEKYCFQRTIEALNRLYTDLGYKLKKIPKVLIDLSIKGQGQYNYQAGYIKYNPDNLAPEETIEDVIKHESLHWFENDTGIHHEYAYDHILHAHAFPGEDQRLLGIGKTEALDIDSECSIKNIMELEKRAEILMAEIRKEYSDEKIIELTLVFFAIMGAKSVYFAREFSNNTLKELISFIERRRQQIDDQMLSVQFYEIDGLKVWFCKMEDELSILKSVKSE